MPRAPTAGLIIVPAGAISVAAAVLVFTNHTLPSDWNTTMTGVGPIFPKSNETTVLDPLGVKIDDPKPGMVRNFELPSGINPSHHAISLSLMPGRLSLVLRVLKPSKDNNSQGDFWLLSLKTGYPGACCAWTGVFAGMPPLPPVLQGARPAPSLSRWIETSARRFRASKASPASYVV